jgi:septal ring factor EnvC (AmiA/AmiB activator)
MQGLRRTIVCFFLGTAALAGISFAGLHGNRGSLLPEGARRAWAADSSQDPKSLLQEIDALEKRLEEVVDRMESLARERDRLARETVRLEQSLADRKTAHARTKQRALRRLNALAKVDWLRLVAMGGLRGDEDFAPFHGAYALRELLRMDAGLLRRLASQRESLKAAQAQLSERRKEMERVLRKLAEERERLDEIKERKILALIRLQEERNPAPPRENPDESAKRKRIARVPVRTRPFESLKGRLPLPVSGQVKREKTKKRSPGSSILYNDGVLIETDPREPVRAVHDGVVVFADNFRGYGRLMIIDHGDHYFSLLAHLGTFLKRTGDRVRAGEPVATLMQEADSAKGMLYFELRHKGRPVRVEDWLAAGKSMES